MSKIPYKLLLLPEWKNLTTMCLIPYHTNKRSPSKPPRLPGETSQERLIVQGRLVCVFLQMGPVPGAETVSGTLPMGGSYWEPAQPRESSRESRMQRAAQNSQLKGPSIHNREEEEKEQEEEWKVFWPCVVFCFFSVSPVSTLYLNYLTLL